MAYGNAVAAALSKSGAPEEEVDQGMRSIVLIAIERVRKFAADRTKTNTTDVQYTTTEAPCLVICQGSEARRTQSG